MKPKLTPRGKEHYGNDGCIHDDNILSVYLAKGPNLLGKVVSCWVAEVSCGKCKSNGVRLAKSEEIERYS